ncbi:MAG: DUF1203 domain-containing protein [Candidatus Eremiobacteraeota bacterium]|nr:DUF1203 domain-containing protein [Candidatus Eremiobacteraeota bacterium]
MVRAIAVPDDFVARMRIAEFDDFGHRIERLRSRERGNPCRSCLRLSEPGDELLLVSYRPLPDTSPYAEVGPIFIHRRECVPFQGEFPDDFLVRPLVVRAYDRRGWISDAVIAQPGEATEAAARFLSREDVAEVHLRHVSYTCFDFKIVRSAA